MPNKSAIKERAGLKAAIKRLDKLSKTRKFDPPVEQIDRLIEKRGEVGLPAKPPLEIDDKEIVFTECRKRPPIVRPRDEKEFPADLVLKRRKIMKSVKRGDVHPGR